MITKGLYLSLFNAQEAGNNTAVKHIIRLITKENKKLKKHNQGTK